MVPAVQRGSRDAIILIVGGKRGREKDGAVGVQMYTRLHKVSQAKLLGLNLIQTQFA